MRLRYLAVAMMVAVASPAFADGASVISDMQSGSWFASHHTTDGGVNTDVCIVAAVNDKGTMFTLRASKDDVEIRIGNDSWNLPDGLDEPVNIVSGDFQQEYRFRGATSNMIITPLEEVDAKPLLSALGKGSHAEMHFGKKIQSIPLEGSEKALNSFRDCVRPLGVMDLGAPVGQTNSPF